MTNLKKLIDIERSARSANLGFKWPHSEMIIDHIIQEAEEVRQALKEKEPKERVMEEVGDLLHCVISLSEFLEFDVEQILQNSANKFDSRLKALKAVASANGLETLDGQDIALLKKLWEEAKKM